MRTLEIQGTAVTFSPGWSIPDRINARTTAQFIVTGLGGLSTIDLGDSVELLNGATVIFSGIVTGLQKSEDVPDMLYWAITCGDNSSRADKRIVADVAENKTMKQVIVDHILPILIEEGVSSDSSYIEDGPMIAKVVFPYWFVAKCLDHLKDLSGYNWNIGTDKKLRVFDRSTYAAPWALTDSVRHLGFRQSQTMNQYRNRQYVLAGTGRTTLQTSEAPSPKPDGVSRKFIVRYPIAERPIIVVNSVEVDPSDIGVNGLDQDKLWYFSYASNVVTQDDSETALTDTDDITIDYYGLYPIRTVLDSDAGIAERQAAEPGTSGIYESVVSEPSLTSINQAVDFANGLIVKYGNIPDKISFSTEVAGLSAGQMLPVVKSLYGINDSFLIESVTIAPADSETIRYNVTALDGAALGGWETFFKDLIGGGRDVSINENDVLVVIKRLSASVTATISRYCSETSYCSESDYCAGGKADAIEWLIEGINYGAVGTGAVPAQGDTGIASEVIRKLKTGANQSGDRVLIDVMFDQVDANGVTITNAAVLLGGTGAAGTGLVIAGGGMNLIKTTAKTLTLSAELIVTEV